MKVLVVVDMQNDFITGPLGTPEAQTIVNNVVRKIYEFDGDLICVTLDTHGKDYLNTQEGRMLPVEHCVVNSPGWRLNDHVSCAVAHHSGTLRKFMKPTFGSAELGRYIKEYEQYEHIDEIVLVGLCTDICVISNAMLIKAFLPEAKITVLADCCAGVTPESHKRALEAMKVCQINIENQ